MLDDVLTHLHTALLIIIQQSWHYFCTDFPDAQIFSDILLKTGFFHVQLICNHLNNQLTIDTSHCLTHLMLTSVLLDEGLLLLESSFTLHLS